MLKLNRNLKAVENVLDVITKKINQRYEDGYVVVETNNLDEVTYRRVLRHYKKQGYRVNTHTLEDAIIISWINLRTGEHNK